MSSISPIAIAIAIIIASTPLLLAAIGELVVEKSGVLNLGVEGMMIVGAVCAVMVAINTHSHLLAIIAAMAGGVATAMLFGFLTQILLANQVACGLALALFGLGLSALVGQPYSGASAPALEPVAIPILSSIPFAGDILFKNNILVYLSFALLVGVSWFLTRTRAGLVLRAVGENPDAAHAIGFSVVRIRLAAIAFGGALAGLAGASLSIAQVPIWVEGMTSQRGWIALVIVVFATWRPWRCLLGAYLFGGVSVLQFNAQALGLPIQSQYLLMLPYLATVAVLVLISAAGSIRQLNAPAALGKPFLAAS